MVELSVAELLNCVLRRDASRPAQPSASVMTRGTLPAHQPSRLPWLLHSASYMYQLVCKSLDMHEESERRAYEYIYIYIWIYTYRSMHTHAQSLCSSLSQRIASRPAQPSARRALLEVDVTAGVCLHWQLQFPGSFSLQNISTNYA